MSFFIWNFDLEKTKYAFKLKSEADLYPHYGYCNSVEQEIRLRNDLPLSMFKFVLVYNTHHIGFNHPEAFKAGWSGRIAIIREEVTSLICALISHPIGGIRTIASMLLSFDRIKIWLKKLMNSEDDEDNTTPHIPA